MWDAQTVQVVWFILNTEGAEAANIYKNLFQVEPDSVQRNRTVGPSTPFISLARGPLGPLHMVVQVQPGRIDVVVQKAVDEFAPSAVLPVFSAVEAVALIMDNAEKAIAELPGVVRLATVVNFIKAQPSYDTALKECYDLMGVKLPIQGTSDFTFQLNKPTTICDSFKMNRLIRLNVVEYQTMAYQNGNISAATAVTEKGNASLMMLDFNIVPEVKPIGAAEQKKILDEIHSQLLKTAALENPLELFR